DVYKRQDKPCLNLHMGQCDSPCSGRIAREEYGDLVRDTCLFLEGRRTSLVNRLELDMQKAAERLEFERASRLRDQMVAICKLVERQKVISTKDVDQDVLCFTHERGLGCVQTLFVRSGKLIGQEHFFLDGTEDEDPQAVLGEFVKQYYRDATYVPKEVLLSHIPPVVGVLQEWLSVRRGTRVRLICPKIGPKRKIVEMAIQNARLAAEREADAQALKDAASKEDLEELREVLGLPEIPERIEAYDISNIQGKEAVGSMVVVQNGKPANSLYRRFKIRTGDTPDDYAMMREVLLRRLARLDDPKFPRPDLMVIDGGRGQLNAALAALSQAGADIQVVSLAKRMEEIYVPGQEEPILLARNAASLRLLQRLRDEAHRFALAYHQKLRGKSATKSVLDSIPGIGDTRRKALIRLSLIHI
ncbi:MAG: excinuclease ABC subunit UvrC, partial [Methanotrichaceae archaeon]|nr:excinuclease ABC subunit UvrC [Methanotrichaceae archaeon]